MACFWNDFMSEIWLLIVCHEIIPCAPVCGFIKAMPSCNLADFYCSGTSYAWHFANLCTTCVCSPGFIEAAKLVLSFFESRIKLSSYTFRLDDG